VRTRRARFAGSFESLRLRSSAPPRIRVRSHEKAAIDQPEVARAILDCLGLSSRAPPLAPASPPEPTDLELGFEDPWSSDESDADG